MPSGVYDRGDPVIRFWNRVNKDGPVRPHMTTPCWLWTRALSHGYGVLRWGDRNRPAHWVAYTLSVGVVADGLDVMHECDNPACCRPDHLRVGTRAQNMRDASARGRLRVGDDHHARKHPERLARVGPRGEANRHAKLTENSVTEIRSSRSAGESAASLARRYNVSVSSIYNVVRGTTWKATNDTQP